MTETTSQAISLVDPYAEHFKEAERLLGESAATIDPGVAQWKVAKAQVHATLANAAANRSQAEGDNRAADAETEQAAALTRLGTTVANGEGGNTGRLMTAVGR